MEALAAMQQEGLTPHLGVADVMGRLDHTAASSRPRPTSIWALPGCRQRSAVVAAQPGRRLPRPPSGDRCPGRFDAPRSSGPGALPGADGRPAVPGARDPATDGGLPRAPPAAGRWRSGAHRAAPRRRDRPADRREAWRPARCAGSPASPDASRCGWPRPRWSRLCRRPQRCPRGQSPTRRGRGRAPPGPPASRPPPPPPPARRRCGPRGCERGGAPPPGRARAPSACCAGGAGPLGRRGHGGSGGHSPRSVRGSGRPWPPPLRAPVPRPAGPGRTPWTTRRTRPRPVTC